MKRRKFIALFGGAAVSWSFAARAQEAGLKRVGVLQPQPESDADFQGWRTIFSSRLRELGWTDGRNIHIDYRFGTGEVASVAPLAKEMVAQQPDALFAITALSALALRQYTLTIPTVFVQVGDPVALGLVTNLARPSGNVTGFSSSDYTIGGKWIETIKDAVPKLRWAAVFFEAGNRHRPNIWWKSKLPQQEEIYVSFRYRSGRVATSKPDSRTCRTIQEARS
jgi:putative tryptophan/tyrosine transport system substrate-binding protein